MQEESNSIDSLRSSQGTHQASEDLVEKKIKIAGAMSFRETEANTTTSCESLHLLHHQILFEALIKLLLGQAIDVVGLGCPGSFQTSFVFLHYSSSSIFFVSASFA